MLRCRSGSSAAFHPGEHGVDPGPCAPDRRTRSPAPARGDRSQRSWHPQPSRCPARHDRACALNEGAAGASRSLLRQRSSGPPNCRRRRVEAASTDQPPSKIVRADPPASTGRPPRTALPPRPERLFSLAAWRRAPSSAAVASSGLVATQRQMVCALLRIADDFRKAPMQLPTPLLRHGAVDGGGEQRCVNLIRPRSETSTPASSASASAASAFPCVANARVTLLIVGRESAEATRTASVAATESRAVARRRALEEPAAPAADRRTGARRPRAPRPARSPKRRRDCRQRLPRAEREPGGRATCRAGC